MKNNVITKNRFVDTIIASLLISLFPGTGWCEESEVSSTRFIQAVRSYADTALEHGRDVYGDKKTPLFVDGLHAETR